MPASVKPETRWAYLRLLAKVIAADGRVDADEIVKLYQVFALLDIPEAQRVDLLGELASDPDAFAAEPVPAELLTDDELRMALAKDVLTLTELPRSEATRVAARAVLEAVRLTSEQVKVLTDWVKMENELLRKLGAGEAWIAGTDHREIASRAAAVGVPLTTLYFAGITGFGAAGLTSGLAAIGAYTGLTVLGLNPMTAGIAGLIMGGISVKKAADFALGNHRAAAQLRARATDLRGVQLKAATALAGDIPRLERQGPGDPERAAALVVDMRHALDQVVALSDR